MSAANRNNDETVRELTEAINRLKLENEEMRESEKVKFDVFMKTWKYFGELGFESKLTKELKQVPTLEKKDYANFMDYYSYWIALKRILINHDFEAYVENVEKGDRSFKMTIDQEDDVIEIIRRSVSPSFHPIIDANLIKSKANQLSATQIMLLIKERVVGNEPKEDEFKKYISNLKLGVNILNIDEYFMKVHIIVEQIKAANLNISENIIVGILFSNLGQPYQSFIAKYYDDYRANPDPDYFFKSISQFEAELNVEHKIQRTKMRFSDDFKKSNHQRSKNKYAIKNNSIESQKLLFPQVDSRKEVNKPRVRTNNIKLQVPENGKKSQHSKSIRSEGRLCTSNC